MAKIKFNKQVNVSRVITKIVATVLGLWVGSEILTSVASSMNNTVSAFQGGMTFLGFSTTTYANSTVSTCESGLTCLDGGVSSTGILSVIGLIAGASIVLEFVKISM